jgi:hypothetical protein
MTNTRMLRYEVPVDDQWHTLACGIPMAVGCRRNDVVEFWAYEMSPQPPTRQFRVFGTGQPFDKDDIWYAGSVTTPDGQYVWHLLERVS